MSIWTPTKRQRGASTSIGIPTAQTRAVRRRTKWCGRSSDTATTTTFRRRPSSCPQGADTLQMVLVAADPARRGGARRRRQSRTRRRLTRFQADPRAVDVSRILRVAGTMNSKNGRLVDIIWLNGPTGAPTTYDFDAFAREILPAHHADDDPDGLLPRNLVDAPRDMTAQDAIAFKFDRELALGHAGRHPLAGHVPVSQRHRATQRARPVRPSRGVSDRPRDDGWAVVPRDRGDRPHLPAVRLRRRRPPRAQLDAAAAGDERGRRRVGRARQPQARADLHVRKNKLIELLEITPDEERSMTRLISDAEKERRRTNAARPQARSSGRNQGPCCGSTPDRPRDACRGEVVGADRRRAWHQPDGDTEAGTDMRGYAGSSLHPSPTGAGASGAGALLPSPWVAIASSRVFLLLAAERAAFGCRICTLGLALRGTKPYALSSLFSPLGAFACR